MDLPDLSPWGISPVNARCRRPDHGTNNDVRIVETPQRRLVWRQYENLSCDRVDSEHRLLEWLAGQHLPFRVPVPLRTVSGHTHVLADGGRAASVHELIPGRRPDDSDHEILLTATGFAHLLRVLADAPIALAPTDWSGIGLRDVYDGSPHADELLPRLAAFELDLGWLHEAMAAEDDLQRALCTLPRQIVHGDVARSNALTDGTRITGLLDFEISGSDARVSDVATTLLSLGGDPATVAGRNRIATLREQLGQILELQPGELEILPEVVRHRLAGSVFWRGGRWLAGQSDVGEVLDRVRVGAAHVKWVAAYAPTVSSQSRE